MTRITDYRDLLVGQQAMKLTESCYQFTSAFPRCEEFGLKAQVCLKRRGGIVLSLLSRGWEDAARTEECHNALSCNLRQL